jgi:hypothetical protein
MKRTPKFLVAMNAAPTVVTTSWVEACVKADALVGKHKRRGVLLIISFTVDGLRPPQMKRIIC